MDEVSDGLLVGLGVVQPKATEDGPDHPGQNQGQSDPPSVQLLTLRNRERKVLTDSGPTQRGSAGLTRALFCVSLCC